MSRNERGSVLIEFILCMGFLVLPLSCFMILSTYPERIAAATAAAYEAARVAVEAPDATTGEADGTQAARDIWTNHGGDPSDVGVAFTAAGRGRALTATVTVTLPALRFPGIGTWDALRLSRSRTLLVPAFRSYS